MILLRKIASLRAGYRIRIAGVVGRSFAVEKTLPKSENMPVLVRKPDAVLLQRWWSEPRKPITPNSPLNTFLAFDATKPLVLPVYKFTESRYSGENIGYFITGRIVNELKSLTIRSSTSH